MNPDLCICLERWPSEPDPAAGNVKPETCALCNRRFYSHGALPVLNTVTHRIEHPEHGVQETCGIDWEPRGFSAEAWKRIKLLERFPGTKRLLDFAEQSSFAW